VQHRTSVQRKTRPGRDAHDYVRCSRGYIECSWQGVSDCALAAVPVPPSWLRRYHRTSNHIERLNKELKRRSKAIGVFPNEDSIIRLMGSVLIELNDAMMSGKAIFSRKTLAGLLESDVPAQLIVIAGEQQHLRAA